MNRTNIADNNMKKVQLLTLICSVIIAAACNKPKNNGDLSVNVDYSINGKPLVTDTLCYTNEAGNRFMVTEIQWFMSDIQLLDEEGKWHTLKQRDALDSIAQLTENIFYIDTDIPESQTLHAKKVSVGHYSALRFTFGLDERDNESGRFNDPPESEMFWPDVLGGGYHYMKLNGKFSDEGRLKPLAIHLGIGQNTDCTEFYHNYFIVQLPIDFTVTENAENQIDLTMIVDNWFRNPNTIDFNAYGSGIMQSQTAQRLLSGNGKNVFRIGQATETQNDIAMRKDEKILEQFRNIMQKAAPKPHFMTWENMRHTFEQIKEGNKKRL